MSSKKGITTVIAILVLVGIIVGISEWVKANNREKITRGVFLSMSNAQKAEQKADAFKRAAEEFSDNSPMFKMTMSGAEAASTICLQLYHIMQYQLNSWNLFSCNYAPINPSVYQYYQSLGSSSDVVNSWNACTFILAETLKWNEMWNKENCASQYPYPQY